MQHRKELIHEASKSLLQHYPTLGQSELREMVKQGYREHLTGPEEDIEANDRLINEMKLQGIIDFLCFGTGSMSCDATEDSPYR